MTGLYRRPRSGRWPDYSAGASVREVPGSHLVYVSQPQAVADLIHSAVESLAQQRSGACLGPTPLAHSAKEPHEYRHVAPSSADGRSGASGSAALVTGPLGMAAAVADPAGARKEAAKVRPTLVESTR
jgi:hypothetical protein